MKRCLVRLFWGCLFASAFSIWGAEDLVLSTQVGEVSVDLFIPGNVPLLRGLFVHAANYSLKPNDRWAEAGRTLGFGHLAMNFRDVRKALNRPRKLRIALEESLKHFADKSAHAELLNLPFAGTGHSAGSLVTPVLLDSAGRTLTLCVDSGWVSDPRKLKPADKSVPMLFTLGAMADAYDMLPDITNKFVPARQDGWLWGLGVQHGCAHDFGNSATLMIPWMDAVIRARLPKDWDPRQGPPKLQDMKLEDGWLADHTSISGTWATIAPFPDYKGDKSQAVWLPNRAVAFVWRAWQSKNCPVTLQISTSDGKAKLQPWGPKEDRTLMVNPGAILNMSVTVEPGVAVKRVGFYDEDKKIADCVAAPWRTSGGIRLTQGPHAISAVWEARDGTLGAVNPALVVVRKTPASE